jgi:chemotaxis protein CheC
MLTTFDADQTDALREIVNVGMGAAGNALALTLDTFVKLPVPSIRLIRSADILSAITDLTGTSRDLTVVRQAFTSSFRGEAVVIFGADSARDLGPYLGYDSEPSRADREEILLDITNLVVGACIGRIAQQLSYDVIFSPPSFIGHNASVEEVLGPHRMTWECSLLIEVSFRLENEPFVCHILLFWPQASMGMLAQAIERVLGEP